MLFKRTFSKSFKPRLTQLFIDGKFVNALSGKTFQNLNPHNEEVTSHIHEAGTDDVDRAVGAAKKAFEHGPWRKTSGQDRAKLLHKLADLIEKNKEELAYLDALDNGQLLPIAMYANIQAAIDWYRYYAGWADKIHGETIPMHGDYFGYTRKEPVGVCALFVPFNFPQAMIAWKLGPALAAGCTTIIHNSQSTPLSALRFCEIAKEAGIPDGVVNALNGTGAVSGKYLSEHPDVDKISFTGSDFGGRSIMSNCSKTTLKRVNLELEGKSANIVLPDADIASALEWTHLGVFANTGQICISGSRLFVHESIHDAFVEKQIARAKLIVPGDQFDPKTTQGPLVSKQSQNRAQGFVEGAKKEGAEVVLGGHKLFDKGFHYAPTILTGVKDHMQVAKKEIFGPVMSILKYSDIDEVIHRANDSEYGLAAGVFGRNVNDILHVVNSLRVGAMFVN